MKTRLISTVIAVSFAFSPLASAADKVADPVTEAELHDTIAVLASDDFGGRGPGTAFETKTIDYIGRAFNAAGLYGGAEDGGYFMPVELTSTEPLSSALILGADGAKLTGEHGIVFYDGKPMGEAAFDGIVTLTSLDVPTGLDVPAGTDYTGKLLVVDAGANARQSLQDMEKLTAAKPAAILVLLPDAETMAAVTGYFGRASTKLASGSADENEARGVIGFATKDVWTKALAGKNAATLTGRIATQNAVRDYTSHNVVAKIRGGDPAKGAVFFTGHWDHLGTCGNDGDADRICNGAVDNASGIAVLVATAKRLAKMGPFDRDIYFVATTAEEKGLLGAYWLVDHPPVPLDTIVAAFNVDTVAIARRGAKVAIIGRGKTELDPVVDKVARKLGREVDASDEANAFIRRQDGWALVQRGVPAVMVGGSFSDMALLEAFLGGPYHHANDELTDATPLGGAAEDADLHVALGAYVADADKYKGTGSAKPTK